MSPHQVLHGAGDQVQVLVNARLAEPQPQAPAPPLLSGYSVICTAGFLPCLSPEPLSLTPELVLSQHPFLRWNADTMAGSQATLVNHEVLHPQRQSRERKVGVLHEFCEPIFVSTTLFPNFSTLKLCSIHFNVRVSVYAMGVCMVQHPCEGRG